MHGESRRQSLEQVFDKVADLSRTQIVKVGDKCCDKSATLLGTCSGLCCKVGVMEFGLKQAHYVMH